MPPTNENLQLTYALFTGHSELGTGSKQRLAHCSDLVIGDTVGVKFTGVLVCSFGGGSVVVKVIIGDWVLGGDDGCADGCVVGSFDGASVTGVCDGEVDGSFDGACSQSMTKVSTITSLKHTAHDNKNSPWWASSFEAR